MRALHRRRGGRSSPVRDLQAGLSTAIKKRSSVSVSRASGTGAPCGSSSPPPGPGSDKHLPGACAVGRLKTQGHDPFPRHPTSSCCGLMILTLRSPFCRRMAGISLAADAAVEAVAKGTPGRGDGGSKSPPQYRFHQTTDLSAEPAPPSADETWRYPRRPTRRGPLSAADFAVAAVS